VSKHPRPKPGKTIVDDRLVRSQNGQLLLHGSIVLSAGARFR
jgi:hypothetical protein